MEENFNPTAEEVIAELSNSQDGKVQLEMAVLRVIVSKQRAHIASTAVSEDSEGKKGD
jgi:hypothetical protein|tara:strand:+ start:208 stop:381 length:174 start_codon:yes stop_codon:yes gene_type:complete